MKKINKKVIVLFSCVFLIASFAVTCATANYYEGLGKGTDIIPLNSRTITGVLPNGLRYFILENSLPENRAHLALIVNAGSVLERDDQRGFAHFVEHLAFNDTARFPKLELIEYLRSLGMRFGADANAYTSYDETVYHFDVPVENMNGIKRIPDRAIAILDDWTYAVSFKPEDVQNESRVILEELRSRLGATDRVRKIRLPILFKGSEYANREPIGLPQIIENATSEQLKEFYSRWYTSDNMALVFVGDFDGKALEKELVNHFNMPKAQNPVNRPLYELPPPKKNNFHAEIITDPELTSVNFNIYYKLRKSGAQRGTIEYYRESIIDYLIDTMLEFRFDEAALNPDTAYTESWAGIWRWSANSRFYTLWTQPKTDNIEQALRELLLEKEAIRRYGFTESEFELAKIRLVSYLEKLLSEKDRTESRTFIRGFTNYFLFGEDMPDIEWEVNAVNTFLHGIKLNEISKRAKDYFSANDCVVFLIAPVAEESNLPSVDRIKAIFNETQNEKITPRKNVNVSGELMDYIPSAGTIRSETIDRQTNAVIITLENGARVILKETANKNNEIVLYAIAKGGTINATEETFISAELLPNIIEVSGLGQFSKTKLVSKLAGKQVSVSFWNSHYSRGFQGSSTNEDLNTLFEMLHLFFTQPRLDERAIEAMKDQYRTLLLHQDQDPGIVFQRELNKILYNNHPFFKTMEVQDIEKLTIKNASEYLNRCLNPSDYTFIFTGNLNPEKMRELTANYLASIQNPGSAEKSMNMWVDPKIQSPQAGRRAIYKGVDQRSTVYLQWKIEAPSVFNEYRNQSASILSEYLDIMLTDEIREKMGGVYSIYAGASISVIPIGENKLSVYFVCDPARADELINTVRNSIVNLGRQTLSTDTFNKAKEAMLMSHERSLQRNIHIAQSYANSFVMYNTPLNRLDLRPNVIRQVTIQDVQALCREITANNPIEIVLFPE
ncbi:MAG: insulinase family protein [Treponema sp.]|nr:insulinase family protein [Treponema sp.]MCL2251008.1 insulinase family protein [Treponema sp.]